MASDRWLCCSGTSMSSRCCHSGREAEAKRAANDVMSDKWPHWSLPFYDDALQVRVSKIKETLEILHDLKDSQLKTTLLRSCLALPKVSYALQTCPPSYIANATRDFNTAIRETLEAILGGPCHEWAWQKASLPSSRGGINLRLASLHAPAAFIASSINHEELVRKLLKQPKDT